MGHESILIEAVSKFWPVLLGLLTVGLLLRNKYAYGITKFPGPPMAAWSNWWRFYQATRMKTQFIHIGLHEKYGDVVRLGPNVLSFSDPSAREEIYGYASNTFIKSDMYKCQQTNFRGARVQSLFATTDEVFHAKLRRCVSNAFAMTTLKSYEDLMDKAIGNWLRQTNKLFAKSDDICEFSHWTQFLAFDIIGQLAWSINIGFTDRNKDVKHIVHSIYRSNKLKIVFGMQPWTDLLMDKNPIKFFFARHGLWPFASDPLIQFGFDRMVERKKELAQIEESKGTLKPSFGKDFLNRFGQSKRDHPEFMTDDRILSVQFSLVNAGSESIGVTMSAILRFLLVHPRVYAKLLAELNRAISDKTITPQENDIFTWDDVQKLPYLDAVIMESWRLHPPAGSNLERVVVKEGGVVLAGHAIPKGTIVGCNPWVLHRRKDVFGEDAETFRPERWIDADHNTLNRMKTIMLHFGGGPRTCIGNNIARMEIYKTIPSFLRLFEYNLADPNKDWKIETHILAKPENFNVRIQSRKIPTAVNDLVPGLVSEEMETHIHEIEAAKVAKKVK